MVYFLSGGKRGIRTLAPVSRPTALAGPPLRPLEYLPIFVLGRLVILSEVELSVAKPHLSETDDNSNSDATIYCGFA